MPPKKAKKLTDLYSKAPPAPPLKKHRASAYSPPPTAGSSSGTPDESATPTPQPPQPPHLLQPALQSPPPTAVATPTGSSAATPPEPPRLLQSALQSPPPTTGSSSGTPREFATPTPQPPQPPSLVITDDEPAYTVPEEGAYLSIRCNNRGGKRRTIISAKTNRIRGASGKIKINWSSFTNGPTRNIFNMLLRDIGAIIKTHVPTLASSFDELEDRHQNILISHLQNMYDINPNDETVLDFINDKASARYRDWKYRCHRHFKKYGVPVPLEFKQFREQWDWLLKNEFLDQAKMAISQRNQRNRTKNPNLMNHHSGSKPLIHRAEEHYEKGSLAPRIQAAIDGYIKCPNDTDIIESLQSSLKVIGQSQTAAATANNTEVEPACLDVELDVLVKCFGERRGTEVRGMGEAVRRPPKKRGGGWSTESSAKRQELEERAEERAERDEERAERAEERMERAEERARKTDEKCDQLSAAGEDMQKRMEAMEQLMRQFLTPQPSS